MRKRTAGLLCLLVGAIWGMGFIATSKALDTFGPFQTLMVRFLGAALIAWIPVAVHRRRISRLALFKGAVCGVFLFAAFALQTLGLQNSEAGSNAFFTSANVVIVPLLAWLIFRRPPALHQLAACLLCFAGVGLMGWQAGGFSLRPGDLLSLGCALFFACHIVALQWASDQDAGIINALQMSVAAALALMAGNGVQTWPARIAPEAILSVAYLIVGSTWLAFALQTRAQESLDASSASLLLATESLWANVFAFLILHERLSGHMLAGGILILAAVCLTEAWPQPELSPTDTRPSGAPE